MRIRWIQWNLEEEFGNEIPDEEAEKLTTVGDVISFIEESQG